MSSPSVISVRDAGVASGVLLEVRAVAKRFGPREVLKRVSLGIAPGEFLTLLGESGSGKTTLLRLIAGFEQPTAGEIWMSGERLDTLPAYKRRVNTVFQHYALFPHLSVQDNVAYGLRIAGITKRSLIDEAVERSLRSAALWEEVKDRLHVSGYGLSGGQQQRLCIARALAVEPEIVLMDEPCSALDPIATAKVEELIRQLKQQYTIVIVTHNMQQAGRCSDNTAFFYLGRLIEFDQTAKIFSNPAQRQTEEYITGRFG